ncbi:MAG: HAD-IA family hydrolase [Desulfotomaculum sp.]|nr:HAD-IA family hydrolase [Desulfotomaculum sp.]
MKINTVLFDLDGTLVDSLPLIKRTFRRVFEEMGIDWGQDEVMKWIGKPLKDIGRHFAGEEREPDFFKLYQKYYAVDHDRYTTVYPGTMEMLERLNKAGFSMGVVTSKTSTVARRSVEYLGIDRYLQVLIGVQDVKKHKPQPEPLYAALDKLNRQPYEAAYIGDSPFDIMAAKAAGTLAIGVPWGMAEREVLENHQPDAIIDSWEDLDKFLGRRIFT